MTKQVDLAILGGGTGGYIAAIAAAQAGKQVTIIERDKLGGTCLHRGCIPSKALLRSAEVYSQAKDSENYGIHIQGVELQFDRVQARKQEIVDQLHRGIQFLMKKHNIEVVYGNGRVMGPSIFTPQSGSVAVELPDGEALTIVPKQLIIATGSKPRILPGLEPDGIHVATSDDALSWDTLPSSIAIVGGGVIGIEWASMLVDFGVEVTVIEVSERILPTEDKDISREMERLLKKRGVRIHTSTTIEQGSLTKSDIGVQFTLNGKQENNNLQVDRVLVSVGRAANVVDIGLENTNVRISNDTIEVNAYMQTHEPHIYAIGDCIGGLQLAHVASAEGLIAVKHMTGEVVLPLSPLQVPKCIYSHPEAASIGMTEQQAKEQGYHLQVSKLPFKAIGKALVLGETDGFVKVVADADSADVLGVHIIGPHATELIGQAALAKLLDASTWELSHVIHAHPSLTEVMGEAMLALEGKSHVM